MNALKKLFLISTAAAITGCGSLQKSTQSANTTPLTEQENCDCLAEKFVAKTKETGMHFKDNGHFVQSVEYLESKAGPGRPIKVHYLLSVRDSTMLTRAVMMGVEGPISKYNKIDDKVAQDANHAPIRQAALNFIASPEHKKTKAEIKKAKAAALVANP